MTRPSTIVIALCVLATPALADEVRNIAPRPPPTGKQLEKICRDNPLARGCDNLKPGKPAPPAKPTPTPEVTQMGKELAGTWTCKGNSMRPDGSSTPLAATVTAKLELDGTWFTMTLVENGGTLKWTAYRNYNPTAKSWNGLKMANSGGRIISSSAGEQGGKWTWNGTAQSANGAAATRDYEQREGKNLKVWGEAQIGGTWAKMYEATCKR